MHVVVPADIDDPARVSGGNVYDRQLCSNLTARGWQVHEHRVAGAWPRPAAAERAALERVLDLVPDGSLVLADGLIVSSVPEIVVPLTHRVRLVVLVHMPWAGQGSGDPAGAAQERAVLTAAAAVVTTSRWSRSWLLDHHPLPPDGVHVAQPGVVPAAVTEGSALGGRLLCVAAVTPGKGHDVLLGALAAVADLDWQCLCIGSVVRDPGHVDRLVEQARRAGIADRVHFPGPRTGAHLEAAYSAADALVLPTRFESYGMVVSEALARGLPVLGTRVGGVPEALGRAPDGDPPGLLVPPEDAPALAAALRSWLADERLRDRLRSAARGRRETLPQWPVTAGRVARVLDEVAA